MDRGILIAGNASTLSAAIAAEAGKREERFCAAFIPYPLERRKADPKELPAPMERRQPVTIAAPGLISLAWNPGSPISARTLTLAAENHLGRVNAAILVCMPPAVRKSAADLYPPNIEIIVNDYIKGWFFLVKELASVFKARKEGALVLVLADTAGGGEGDAPDLIGPSVSASFQAFAQGLMASSPGEPYDVYGIIVPAGSYGSSAAGDDTNVGAFVFKVIEEGGSGPGGRRNAGKWHKFGSRRPFLGR
ncbi:hypothetical protein AGMMS4952_14670 [Spirochaetia bacterium]|nr:hypothetical protein AGMMS4952_14670 [Spirochaetia bacterium]